MIRPQIVLRSRLERPDQHPLTAPGEPDLPVDIEGMENDMTVSADAQSLAAQLQALNAKWQAYTDSQVAAAIAATKAQAEIDQAAAVKAAVDAAVTEAVQDHNDDTAALTAAVAQAGPPGAAEN